MSVKDQIASHILDLVVTTVETILRSRTSDPLALARTIAEERAHEIAVLAEIDRELAAKGNG